MDYLKRYRNGEYEQVWDELKALGPAVRQERYYSQACAVATETMRRVSGNCELIVSRLRAAGYIFGTYPDGSRAFQLPPLAAPSNETHRAVTQFEKEAGPLPLSLVAFWQEVGSVNLIGMHPAWPNGLDPLVVWPPDAVLSCLDEVFDSTDKNLADYEWFAPLAPDDVHKDNESGGGPYGAALPEPSADFQFYYESHNLLFVPYLRLAILQWGGLPGLDVIPKRFEILGELAEGLERF